MKLKKEDALSGEAHLDPTGAANGGAEYIAAALLMDAIHCCRSVTPLHKKHTQRILSVQIHALSSITTAVEVLHTNTQEHSICCTMYM